MVLSGFESTSLSLFGWLGRPLAKDSHKLRANLVKARIEMLPEVYVAHSFMIVLVTFIITLFLTLLILGIGIPMIHDITAERDSNGEGLEVPEMAQYGLAFVLVILLPGAIALIQWLGPAFIASSRGKNMDQNLPYAASYVAALAASNATPSMTFKSLARNESIYHEISKDAAWIFHSVEFLGRDLITTLKEAVDRSASERFAEFLQGIVGTLTSGGNLKLYFLNRAEYYAQMNRNHVKEIIQQMALFAEAYVVGAVALPIFVMIIMVITFWVSGSGMNVSEEMLYAVVFGMLPMIQLFFSYIFKAYSDEITM